MYVYLRPHFLPAGLFLILQRLGIPMAIPGLIPAFLAKGERRTAQRHLGSDFISAPTFAQHGGGTLILGFPAAPRHGLKLTAAEFIGVFPHAPPAAVPW